MIMKQSLRIIPGSGRQYFLPALLALCLLLVTGCMTKTDLDVGEETELDRDSLSVVGQAQYPFDLFKEYKIQPGDLLDVLFQFSTWTERPEFRIKVDHTVSVKFADTPELNEEQRVRPDGSITLPYLGRVHITGLTVDELTAQLTAQYSTILRNPDIYVLVPEFQSAIKELKMDLHTAPRGLSRLVTVRPDGYATFPMVGDMFVGYKTIREVNRELNLKFDDIVEGLHCDLFLEQTAGTKIYIVGEVTNPDAYQIKKPTTVIEALALAGGALPSAELDSVIVARRHENKVVATRVDLERLLAAKDDSAHIFLQGDDIVYVPQTWISHAAQVAEYIRSITFFNGWGIGFGFELHDDEESGPIF